MPLEKILISACLLGRPVRYDGRGKELRHDLMTRWQVEGRLVPICPEVAGGLPTPRPPAEIERGKSGADVLQRQGHVFENTGGDVTEAFIGGAQAALQTAEDNDCRFAILTDGSPSCGSSFIYDGSFGGVRKPGSGVVTAFLKAHGIRVFPESGIVELACLLDRR